MLIATFSISLVSVCDRSYNKVANCLVDLGASLPGADSQFWLNQAPEFVLDLVSGDLARTLV